MTTRIELLQEIVDKGQWVPAWGIYKICGPVKNSEQLFAFQEGVLTKGPVSIEITDETKSDGSGVYEIFGTATVSLGRLHDAQTNIFGVIELNARPQVSLSPRENIKSARDFPGIDTKHTLEGRSAHRPLLRSHQ